MRLAVVMLGGALAACSGGLEAGGLGASARIEGRVLNEAGAPAGGVQVTLHVRRDAVDQVQTGRDGRFALEVPVEGALTLVAYAGGQRGRVAPVDAVAGVTAAVGDLTLGELRLQPEVLALRGVGYEERVAELPGDVLWGASTPDGRWLLLSAETVGQRVRMSPFTVSLDGAAPEVAAGEPFAVGSAYVSEASSLGGDDLLVAASDPTGGRAYWWLTTAGASRRLDPPPLDSGPVDPRLLDRLVAARRVGDHLDVLWSGDGRLARRRFAPDGAPVDTSYLDFEGGAVDAFPAAFDRRTDRLVLLWSGADGALWTYDLADETLAPTGRSATMSWAFQTPEGEVMTAISTPDGTAEEVLRFGPSGAQTLARHPNYCRRTPCGWISGFTDGRLFYRVPGLVGLLSVTARGASTSTITFEHASHSGLNTCQFGSSEPVNCVVRLASEGRVRVEVNGRSHSGYDQGWAIDVMDDGQVRGLRVDLTGNLRRRLYASPGRRWDAYVRVSDTGHTQVHIAPLGAPENDFVAVTYVPRDHTYVGFGPDERWVYSLMQDPLTGRQQLFRARVAPR